MALGLSLRMAHRHRHGLNLLLGLSPLEMEMLLDQSHDNVEDFHQKNPDWKDQNPAENRGNYGNTSQFGANCKSVRGKVPREKQLELPQIIALNGENGYTVEYNPDVEQRIKAKLTQFKRDEKVPPSQVFSLMFERNRKWIKETQVKMTKVILDHQKKYLESNDPLDLKELSQTGLGEMIGYSESTIGRLAQNLTIKLPDGRTIFANELIPGNAYLMIRGHQIMRELQKDPNLYDGKWKVSDQALVPIVKSRYGDDMARRTINKYRNEIRG